MTESAGQVTTLDVLIITTMVTPVIVLLVLMLAHHFARYRVVWIHFSIARTALTRRGALRLASRLSQQNQTEYRVRDVWFGRWVDDVGR